MLKGTKFGCGAMRSQLSFRCSEPPNPKKEDKNMDYKTMRDRIEDMLNDIGTLLRQL